MTLEKKLGNICRSVSKNLRKYALATVLTANSYLGVNTSKAADYYIDPSWSLSDINGLFDTDPKTSANIYADTILQPGDNVHFSSGIYELPFEPNSFIRVDINTATPENKIRIIGNSQYDTILRRGPGSEAVSIMKVYQHDIAISDFKVENCIITAIHFIGQNYGNNLVERINVSNVNKFVAWDNYYIDGDNSQPSVRFNNIFLTETAVGFNFNNLGKPTTNQSKYISFSNITAENVELLTEVIFPNNVLLAKGEFADCIVTNSGSIFSEQESMYYNFETTPDGFVEWNNESLSLSELGIGEYNLEADPFQSWSKHLLPLSPAWHRNFPGDNGYAGSFQPAGDFDGNGLIEKNDLNEFYNVYIERDIKISLETNFARVFDFNGDAFITNYDDTQLKIAYNKSNGIPDFNVDNIIGPQDLAIFLGAWGSNPGHPADLNGDRIVNATDLAQLLGSWGQL